MDLKSVKSAVGIWNQKGKFIIEYFMGPIILYLQWLTWQTVQTLMHFEIKIQLQLVIMQGIMQFSLTIFFLLRREDSIPCNKSKFFLRYHIHIHRTFNDLGPS